MKWETSRRVLGVMLACALSGGLLLAQGDRVQKEFPKHEEMEFEHSIITIPIILHGETEPAEVLKLDAYMRLDREKPVRNGIGYRQFEFTIADWELHGYSKVLDAYMTFSLSNTVKPKSLGVALQKNKDYPAMIVYNAIYDIFLDDVKVGENRAGVAFATGVMEIPPRNITVAFNKPFAFGHARPGFPNGNGKPQSKRHDNNCLQEPCPCQESWCMGPGSCEDMEPISELAFEEGVAKAKSYRAKGSRARMKSPEGTAAAPAAKKKSTD